MFISLSLILLGICVVSNALNILCLLPYNGKSHHLVFEPLLEALADRGHNLTVVSFFPKSEPRTNRRDVSLEHLASLNVEVINIKDILPSAYFGWYFDHLPTVIHLARSNLELCKLILNSEVFKEFVDARGDYDLIITEHFNSDCMLGIVHKYGLPSIGLMSCAMLPWSYSRVGAPDNPSYVPGMTLPFTDRMTLFERMENTFIHIFYVVWFEVNIRWKEQRLLEEKLGDLPSLADVGKKANVVLVNTHYTWNGVRTLPPSVVEVGGIHLHNRTVQELPAHLEDWVSSASHGFIIFSFGSLIRSSSMTDDMSRAFLNVFAKFPQRFIWKWEAEIADLPENVRVLRWLPQYDLLRHSNCVAFISHGGMLSLTEAVSAGIPVLVIPLLGDQFGNAEHAKRSGFGQVLKLADFNENNLLSALNSVVSPVMTARAKQVSQMWHDRQHHPMETAIFEVERTARHKTLDVVSDVYYTSRFQLALIDVIICVFVIVLFSVIFISNDCSKIRRGINLDVRK